MFPLEYNFDSKAKRLCEAKKVVCVKHAPGNQIVVSVKIKIATVESAPPRHHPIPAGDLIPKKSPIKKFDTCFDIRVCGFITAV